MYTGKPINLLVADTEGLSSLEADQTHDVKIFTLSILTCSHFIYYSDGNITKDALDKLSVSANLAQGLRGGSAGTLTA